MALYENQDLEYMVDEYYYDTTDFEDSTFGDESSPRSTDLDDSDFEDDFEVSKSKTDTSAVEARNGKDIQGIPWERLNFTRNKYREARLKQYKNYENLSRSREALEKDCKEVEKGHSFYDFQFNTRLVKSTIVHFQFIPSYSEPIDHCIPFSSIVLEDIELLSIFSSHYMKWLSFNSCSLEAGLQLLCEQLAQAFHMLRNLLWSTSKHDVYLMQNHSVMHWSSLLRRGKEVLNVARPLVPTMKYPGSEAQTLTRVQISNMAVRDGLMAAGGFQGELICKYLNQPGVAFAKKISNEENAITNAVDICYGPTGSMRIMTANNDQQVRFFDVNSFACTNCYTFPWSVNNTSVSPDGKLLAVLGDSPECLLADAQSGKVGLAHIS
ncbi:Transducin/WD40 repeat-like superfamily protein isoform 2 [Capsicum annuum]|nr:Transducin/WD40 repeat-like superfamily protein isoform 2 [Capsicum annuum]